MPIIDRRILKSQDAIKKAVIELMSKNSFDDITIQDISDKGMYAALRFVSITKTSSTF